MKRIKVTHLIIYFLIKVLCSFLVCASAQYNYYSYGPSYYNPTNNLGRYVYYDPYSSYGYNYNPAAFVYGATYPLAAPILSDDQHQTKQGFRPFGGNFANILAANPLVQNFVTSVVQSPNFAAFMAQQQPQAPQESS